MHINSHFAVGVIFASILNYFFKFTLLEFSLIVLFSFFCDFDVLFIKFAKDHNHRLLITHSIIPSIILIIIGYILMWPVLIICGFSYSIHIIIDTIDWGTNFFYFQKKQIGFKFSNRDSSFYFNANLYLDICLTLCFFDCIIFYWLILSFT